MGEQLEVCKDSVSHQFLSTEQEYDKQIQYYFMDIPSLPDRCTPLTQKQDERAHGKCRHLRRVLPQQHLFSWKQMLHMYHSGKNSSFVVDPVEAEQCAVRVGPRALVLTAFDHPQYTSLDASLPPLAKSSMEKLALWACGQQRRRGGNVDDL